MNWIIDWWFHLHSKVKTHLENQAQSACDYYYLFLPQKNINQSMDSSHSGLNTTTHKKPNTLKHTDGTVAMQTHSLSSHLLQRFFFLTWQLGKASVKKRCQNKTISMGGVLASSQVKCKKSLCWIPPWDSGEQSPLLRAVMDGPQPSPVPASYLALPLILSSSSGLNPLSLCHSTPLFLSLLPPCHEHNHMCTYYTTIQGRMSTEQKQRASVGQSLAINRLPEFIIVSSYDGEEPRGLGEREEGRPSSITLCWLLLHSLYRLQAPYHFHLPWSSSSCTETAEPRWKCCWHPCFTLIKKTWDCSLFGWTVVWLDRYTDQRPSIYSNVKVTCVMCSNKVWKTGRLDQHNCWMSQGTRSQEKCQQCP